MKTHILYSGAIVFGSLIIVVALAWPGHSATSRSNNGEQLKALQNRISQLETKAASLEKELERLQKQATKQMPTVIYTPANEVVPSIITGQAPAQTPPGWKPFEFNGMTYYFAPLGQKTEVSMSPLKAENLSPESILETK